MDVRLRYFEGCPHWRTMYERLRGALDGLDLRDVDLVLERVETAEQAERLRFVGSPTVLIDGRDPFETSQTTFGLTCRLFETPDGLAGSPTSEQLRWALERKIRTVCHRRLPTTS